MFDLPLLRTGEVARQLGVSRQHVVDMCESGQLPFQRVGVHRRIQQKDVDRLRQRPAARSSLTREGLRSLWYHRAVAGHVAQDPDRALEFGRRRLRQLLDIHPHGMSNQWLRQWESLLERGPEAVMSAITSDDPLGQELRANSVLIGLLTQGERASILTSFSSFWRRSQSVA